jgi:hypothetical protein
MRKLIVDIMKKYENSLSRTITVKSNAKDLSFRCSDNQLPYVLSIASILLSAVMVILYILK